MNLKEDWRDRYKEYQPHLLETLKDYSEASAYLAAVLDDLNHDELALALCNIATAAAGNPTKVRWARDLIQKELNYLASLQQITDGEISVLPCPFCGGEDIKTFRSSLMSEHYHQWEICCLGCGASVKRRGAQQADPDPVDEGRLINKWNARA